jgi:lipopolysaccharide/colanic/teichoic acid biosynthesis glycosyltransferase
MFESESTNKHVRKDNLQFKNFGSNLKNELNNNLGKNPTFSAINLILSQYIKNVQQDVLLDVDFLQNQNNFNEHLNKINSALEGKSETLFIGVIETLDDWRQKKKILKKPIIGNIFRVLFFVFFRILPKLKWYQFLTNYKTKRLFSKAEILGRFIYNGFEISDFFAIDTNFHVFILIRKNEPMKQFTSEGVLLKINRIGKNGKIFKVYKLRTMHPYSEYLHEHMIKTYGFNSKGKIKNDFRTTKWAKYFRKYWLDELPQLFNILKLQMKLVGIRPVSESYFNSLPKEIQEKRITHKPGCIPPYLAHDFGTSKESVLEAELVYIEKKNKNPFTTDFKYFFVAIFNIVFRGKRSS